MTNITVFWNTVNAWASGVAAAVRSPLLTKVAIFITDVGGPIGITILSLILITILWLHKKRGHLLLIVVTLAVSAGIVWLIKQAIQLPRPTGGLIAETGYSFASGHATYAAVFFSLIVFSYKAHIPSLFWRRAVMVMAVVIALLIGLSRVYLGVHYLSDVIGGFIIGSIISYVAIWIFNRVHGKVRQS